MYSSRLTFDDLILDCAPSVFFFCFFFFSLASLTPHLHILIAVHLSTVSCDVLVGYPSSIHRPVACARNLSILCTYVFTIAWFWCFCWVRATGPVFLCSEYWQHQVTVTLKGSVPLRVMIVGAGLHTFCRNHDQQKLKRGCALKVKEKKSGAKLEALQAQLLFLLWLLGVGFPTDRLSSPRFQLWKRESESEEKEKKKKKTHDTAQEKQKEKTRFQVAFANWWVSLNTGFSLWRRIHSRFRLRRLRLPSRKSVSKETPLKFMQSEVETSRWPCSPTVWKRFSRWHCECMLRFLKLPRVLLVGSIHGLWTSVSAKASFSLP